jgi:mercuric ion binding protein
MLLHSLNLFLYAKKLNMKTLKIFFLSFLLLSLTTVVFAQTKTEKLNVSGECNTCKHKIEAAAKNAGASYAVWNASTKVLTVKYNSTSTNTAKIENAVAAAGYDTPDVKATNASYDKLDDCCKYDRANAATDKGSSCCDAAKCKEAACMKDGKCTPDMSCCKDAGCDTKACCKKA